MSKYFPLWEYIKRNNTEKLTFSQIHTILGLLIRIHLVKQIQGTCLNIKASAFICPFLGIWLLPLWRYCMRIITFTLCA